MLTVEYFYAPPDDSNCTCSFNNILPGVVEGGGGGGGGVRHAEHGCRKCVKFYQMMNLTQCRQTDPATLNLSVKFKFFRSDGGRLGALRVELERTSYYTEQRQQ